MKMESKRKKLEGLGAQKPFGAVFGKYAYRVVGAIQAVLNNFNFEI